MLELQAFGPIDLRADGGDLGIILTRPKRLALLLYLVLARPQRYQRRDTLLALFWPELDQLHARKALSQSLFVLRSALPASLLQVRGDEEVGVDLPGIRCDVLEFEQALAERRWADAVELYRGELLAGFHVPDAPGFESWLDGERERLRELAAGAAWSLARQRIQTGELVLAERAGQRALHLVPTDESPVRDFIRALAAAGDRAAALRFYDKFAGILAEELEVEPSAETAAVMKAIRADPVGTATTTPMAGAGITTAVPSAMLTGPGATPAHMAAGADEPARPATPASAEAIPSGAPERRVRARHPRLLRWALVSAGAVVVLAGFVGFLVLRARQPSTVARRVAVLPFENRTGDRALDPLGVVAADWITAGVARIDTVQAVSTPTIVAALAEPGAGPDRPRWIAQRTGAGLVVTGYLVTAGDSLELRSELVDPIGGEVLDVFDPARSPRSDPARALGSIRQQIMGRVALRLDTRMAGMLTVTGAQPPTYDAYRAYMAGLDLFTAGRFAEAIGQLSRAWAADSSFVAPAIWIASAYMNLGQWAREDSIVRRLEARRASLGPLERGPLNVLEAMLRGDNAAVYRMARDGYRHMPSGEGRFMTGLFALHTNRLREAVQTLQSEPENGPTRNRWFGFHYDLTLALHCSREYKQELKAAREAHTRFPDRPEPVFWQARALIGLGRVDEALTLVDQALTLRSAVWFPAATLGGAAHELRVHGYPRPAQRLQVRALAWLRANSPVGRPNPAVALALKDLGHPDSAAAILQQLATERPDVLHRQGPLALALITAGRVPEARLVDQRLAAWTGPYVWGQHLYWRAAIAARLGEKDRAVALLRDAVGQGYSYAFLYEDENLQPLWTYPAFRKFMKPRTD